MTEAEKTHSYKKETALTKPRVVIVGGGFGGLYAARALAGAPVSVTLIDKRNYHLFRPLLYQVATGLLSADEISGPLRSILSRQNNIDVLLGEVTGVDTQKRAVRLEQHDIPYDFLILATGVQYNYFGHDEWSRIAPSLVSLSDADRIGAKVLLAFERAEELAALELAQTTSPQIQKLLTFVLVGAGTVGVEMASTLAEMSRMALAHDFHHIVEHLPQLIRRNQHAAIFRHRQRFFPDANPTRAFEHKIKFLRTDVLVQRVRAFGWQSPQPRAQILAARALQIIRVRNFHQVRRPPVQVFRLDEVITLNRFHGLL
jgi:NADPH-dependent 2,4-dienoyl-CoA reductase/sulfur reductase-like enzyme